jgi:SAM-dependent methyltransferase
VIEHVERPELVIDNIAAVLAPGGVAVVSLPNALSLPFLLLRLERAATRRPLDPELRAHLRYPFYRSLHLFEGYGLDRVTTTGTNLVLVGPLIRLLYGRRWFPLLNRLNFQLSGSWPFKYASQFFFVVTKKNDMPLGDGRAAV